MNSFFMVPVHKIFFMNEVYVVGKNLTTYDEKMELFGNILSQNILIKYRLVFMLILSGNVYTSYVSQR